MAKFPVAYVEWVDSHTLSEGWEPIADVLERKDFGRHMESAGLLIHQDDEGILLAVGFNPSQEDVVEVMSIPREQVKRLDLWNPDA